MYGKSVIYKPPFEHKYLTNSYGRPTHPYTNLPYQYNTDIHSCREICSRQTVRQYAILKNLQNLLRDDGIESQVSSGVNVGKPSKKVLDFISQFSDGMVDFYANKENGGFWVEFVNFTNIPFMSLILFFVKSYNDTDDIDFSSLESLTATTLANYRDVYNDYSTVVYTLFGAYYHRCISRLNFTNLVDPNVNGISSYMEKVIQNESYTSFFTWCKKYNVDLNKVSCLYYNYHNMNKFYNIIEKEVKSNVW